MSHVATKKQGSDLAFAWQLCIAFVLSALVIVAPDLALATPAPTTPAAFDIFCTVSAWFTGSTGKGLATIAITIIGIGALLGKVSWGMALIVGTGVAIIFGAASIVDAMNTTGGAACP